MRQEDAKRLSAIITAWGEGKALQIFNGDIWVDATFNPDFNSCPTNYRIKPEPEVIYVNKYEEDGDVEVFFSQEAAKKQDGRYEYIAKKFTAEE
jgi:hypothetical protein